MSSSPFPTAPKELDVTDRSQRKTIEERFSHLRGTRALGEDPSRQAPRSHQDTYEPSTSSNASRRRQESFPGIALGPGPTSPFVVAHSNKYSAQASNETAGDSREDQFDSRFTVIVDKPSRFFNIGRVFKVLWTEPAGNVTKGSDDPAYHTVGYGHYSYSKVRRFVVIQKRLHCSLCVAISSYGHKGAAKSNVRSRDHAVVYASHNPEPIPEPEEKITIKAFPIIVEESGETFMEQSRINFGKIYTVEHNLKVLRIGRISPQHIDRLGRCFMESLTTPLDPSEEHHESTETTSFDRTSTGVSHLLGELGRLTIAETDIMSDYSTRDPFNLGHGSLCFPPRSISRDPFNLGHESLILPPESISSGYLVSNDSTAKPRAESMYIKGTPGSTEKLDQSYKVRKNDYKTYFKPGRVFSTLWTSSYERSVPEDEHNQFLSYVTDVRFGEKVSTKIRRFLVVRAMGRACNCVPITTYNGMGHKKNGINLAEHALMYSGSQPPRPVDGITKEPLKIQLSRGSEKLASPTYVNIGRIYNVECNVKVKDVGELDRKSMSLLRRHYDEIHHPPFVPDEVNALAAASFPRYGGATGYSSSPANVPLESTDVPNPSYYSSSTTASNPYYSSSAIPSRPYYSSSGIPSTGYSGGMPSYPAPPDYGSGTVDPSVYYRWDDSYLGAQPSLASPTIDEEEVTSQPVPRRRTSSASRPNSR